MSGLAGLRILVVEDEPLVAMNLEDILIGLDCVVVGIASRLNEALEFVQQLEFDAAILDVNIHGEHSFPVAATLDQRGVRYVFATGYGPAVVKDRFSNVPVLEKPYSRTQIAAALTGVLSAE